MEVIRDCCSQTKVCLVKVLYPGNMFDSLPYLCRFHQEQRLDLKETWLSKKSLTRLMLLVINLPIIPAWGIFYRFNELPRYFSNWGTLLVIISLLVCLFAPYDLKIHQKVDKLAWAHLLITFATFTQLIIVPVFWGVLYTEAIRSVRFGLAEKIF